MLLSGGIGIVEEKLTGGRFMAERQPAGGSRRITPRDVFGRCNMPSRWERLTGVAPKIPEDTRFLAFVAARYRGEERLPHPDVLAVPGEVLLRQRTGFLCGWVSVFAVLVGVVGMAAGRPLLAGLGALALLGAVAAAVVVSISTERAVLDFHALRSRCEAAQARLSGDCLDPEYRSTLTEMITCDEGTLAYCAAKVASEIQRSADWGSTRLDVAAIDLWNELAEIGASARQIAEDREMTEELKRGRLRDDPEVRETIEADTRMRTERIALLAARVSALADYRDRVHRRGAVAVRDSRLTERAISIAADELAARKLP